jgi:hypothetical protein
VPHRRPLRLLQQALARRTFLLDHLDQSTGSSGSVARFPLRFPCGQPMFCTGEYGSPGSEPELQRQPDLAVA